MVFAKFPKLRVLKAAFYWLPADTYTKHTFHRNDLDDIWAEFDDTLSAMEHSFEEGVWPKKKTGLCPWCPVFDCEHFDDSKKR